MSSERYVAYVGTYTHGNSVGIHIYDLDVDEGTMKERKVVPINNPSDVTVSKDGKFLYSIADEGVESFRILPDGDLEPMNEKWIGGMRGCYVEVDDQNRYLFVAGYHDGRVTMMRLNEDGSIGEIADGIFHKGLGRNIADRSAHPHVDCVMLTPGEQNYLCAVDGGLDHVKVYKLDYENGKMQIADILRCPMNSSPHMMRFSKDGRFAYVLCELSNTVEVYRFSCTSKGPEFEFLQSISTIEESEAMNCGASGMEITEDGKYIFCSNAGANTVIIYEIDGETGMLSELCSCTISGDYPKVIGIFPGEKYFASLNHDTNEITIFNVNYEKKYFLMKGKPLKVETPNCIHIHKLL